MIINLLTFRVINTKMYSEVEEFITLTTICKIYSYEEFKNKLINYSRKGDEY